MKKKIINTLNIVLIELISNGIGWIAGLSAADLVGMFFVKRKWYNLGGSLSKKTAVDAETYNIMEWLGAAVIGYIVLVIVNKLVVQKLFKDYLLKLKLRKKQAEHEEELADNSNA